jgi:hypothetical protein
MQTPEQIAAGLLHPPGSYHYPCGRRIVVAGKWGHQLAHPSDCPDCARLRALISKETDNG